MDVAIVPYISSSLSTVDNIGVASEEDIRATFDARWADNTHRSYRGQWNQFVEWCNCNAMIAMPATPEVVSTYLISRSVAGRRMPTLRSGASAIAAAHKGNGLENPCATEIVRAAMAGRNRLDQRVPNQKRPLDDRVLDGIIKNLWVPRRKNWGRMEHPTETGNRAMVDEALVLLMQCCALRRAEVVSLEWSDFLVESDGSGRLAIRRSKTDQTGEGFIAYVSRRGTRALLAIIPEDTSGAIFSMTAETVSNRIKAAVQSAGYDPDDFGGHSGRIGFAVLLTEKQAPTSEVMRMGRWRGPSMVAHYTRGIEAAASARWLE